MPLVAQQPQVPRRRAELLRTPAGRRAGRRPGPARRRTRRAAPAAGPAAASARRDRPAVSASMCRSAPAGSAKPSAASRRPGLGRRQPQRLGRHPGDRLEQRSVEQLLVQPADLAGVQRPLGLPHLLARRRARPAGSPCAGPASCSSPRVVGHAGGCGAAGAAAAGARPRAGTCRRRAGSPRRRGRRSRRRAARPARPACPATRSASSPRPWTSCSSCTANSTSRRPPRPELDLAVGDRRLACARPPAGAWPARRRRSPAARPRSTPAARSRRGTRAPSVEVAGDRPGLEQRLELPGAGPAPVVGLVAGQRPHQRAVLALRPQPRVDLPGDAAADPHRLAGQRRRRGQRGVDVAVRRSVGSRRVRRRTPRRRRRRSSARGRRPCPSR